MQADLAWMHAELRLVRLEERRMQADLAWIQMNPSWMQVEEGRIRLEEGRMHADLKFLRAPLPFHSRIQADGPIVSRVSPLIF